MLIGVCCWPVTWLSSTCNGQLFPQSTPPPGGISGSTLRYVYYPVPSVPTFGNPIDLTALLNPNAFNFQSTFASAGFPTNSYCTGARLIGIANQICPSVLPTVSRPACGIGPETAIPAK